MIASNGSGAELHDAAMSDGAAGDEMASAVGFGLASNPSDDDPPRRRTMGARQLLAIGFRLLAIWLGVSALRTYSVLAAPRLAAPEWIHSAWPGLFVIGTGVAIALVIWLMSGAMARGLMSGVSRATEPRFTPLHVIAVGCVLMGLWWLDGTVFPFATLWMKAFALSGQSGQALRISLGTSGELKAVTDLAQIAVTAIFVLRPYALARQLLRHAPAMPRSDAEPSERAPEKPAS